MKKKKNRLQPKQKKSNSDTAISIKHKRLFTLITLLIPVIFLIILELTLYIIHYGANTKLFVSTPTEKSVYYGIDVNICKRYFRLGSFNPTPRKDLFLKKKPDNCYRIFVLGGSTAAGFPYGNNLNFARILNRRLSDTFPNKHIEVINTAFTAINSYTILDFMDEIIEQQPDALLIYAGHNEFYGALGVASMESLGKIRWIVKAYLKLQRYRTFVLLQNAIGWIKKTIAANPENDLTSDPMKTVMSRIVKNKEIPLGSKLYQAGVKQFKNNLNDILKKASDANIPVLISELISNVRDQKPFVSIKFDTLPSADEIYADAVNHDKNGEYHLAKNEYKRAKDLDALRFRAPSEFNDIIHSLASKFNASIVPMEAYFEKESPHGIIGNNLICEHLHPNIDGYFLMAEAFYNTMRQQKLINPNWFNLFIKPSKYYQSNWGITKLDSAHASLNIAHLKDGWPFKKTGPNRILQNFKPITKEDSVALDMLKSVKLTLELGHIELAKYYTRKGNLERAFKEYKALIYTVPHLDLFYEPIIKLLVDTNQYAKALNILNDAIKYNNSVFVYKWIGHLSLAVGDTQKGILYLEKVRSMDSEQDAQVLFNLCRAYYNTSQFKRGDEILSILKKILPNSEAVKILETFRTSVTTE